MQTRPVTRKLPLKLCFLVGTAITIGQIPAYGTLVNVATPGNVLALLPVSDLASSSDNTSFAALQPLLCPKQPSRRNHKSSDREARCHQ
jgi:hypothetical protein